ncbi:MAG: zinc ribbon domain-containing protein [Candidatus Lokiarchaeota archaeon]|nr:zinc ribbon domain-containing protein [Candidatus Lokiarchaeota archaeon]
MSVQSFNRCPRCGNENRGGSYACSFCGKRLRIERIEKISIFKRIEIEWSTPAPWYLKIIWLFIRPNKAFWDINHKRNKAPGHLIILFNALIYGLMGVAYLSHFIIPDQFLLFLYNLSVFTAFFLMGLIFNYIFGTLLIWFFIKGANSAVGFSEILEARFGGDAQKETYREAEMSPFSIYKGGTLHQQKANKYKMMYCAFTPFLLINLIEALIIFVGFPTVSLEAPLVPTLFTSMFNSPTWAILHAIDALTIAIWIPILMTLAIRELSNSSTVRVLLASFGIGILTAIIVFFLRPSFLP